MKHYDAIIIGFGKGGKTLAAEYAKHGLKTAIIEKSNQMYGGTCINEGCIPSKSLIIQAGIKKYPDAVTQKEALITALRKANFDKLNRLENVDVITATASFLNEHKIHIESETHNETVYGDKIFINTGSIPNIPKVDGISTTKYIYTSAQMMKQDVLPEKLAIIGGGYIGLEFSSMYAKYKSAVTVFEHGERLVKREDKDVADEIQNVLQKQGVSFEFSSTINLVRNENDKVSLTYTNQQGTQKTTYFDAVLLAAGRHANTENLALEHAGIETDQYGNIIVNQYLQTNIPHIYALGDVKGGLQFTYISLDDYRIVKDHIFGQKKRTVSNRGHIAYSVFISPTFSRVGLSEQEAIAAGHKIKTAHLNPSSIPRAKIISQTEGLLKAVIDADSNQILGCVLFCAESEELINFVQLAMNQKLTYDAVANHIFTHPTMSEALNDLFNAVK